MGLSCSHCGSEDLTKASFVYEQGTLHGQSSSTGMAVGVVGGRIGIGYGGGSTTTTQLTSTALRAAPPSKKRTPIALYFVIFIGGLVSAASCLLGLYQLVFNFRMGVTNIMEGLILGALTIYLPIKTIQKNIDFNRSALPELYDAWTRSYMCNRCGVIEEPSA